MDAGTILVVEDDPSLRSMLSTSLEVDGYTTIEARGGRLEDALRLLEERQFDAVLLDLSLPDSDGLETVASVHEHAPDVPIVVVTGVWEENLGVDALRAGAQDYLVKGEIDVKALVRALRYAVERHRLQAAFQELSVRDELTGLYNRRGFRITAEHQLKLARRSKVGCSLVFIDVDRLKGINDQFGHRAGDAALRAAAALMQATFRESDVLARLGGDEFVALLIGVDAASSARSTERLGDALRDHNDRSDQPYTLSLSAGVVWFDPQTTPYVDEVMERADRAMYEKKQELTRSRPG